VVEEPDVILPSEQPDSRRPWSPDHQRLHRHLLRRPTLLPQGAPLLLAVSGGQDSMALATLLQDLQPLHGWHLRLWHGDHGWRPEAALQAEALADWARSQGLPFTLDRMDPAAAEQRSHEEGARRWRYGCLEREARLHRCDHIVTGHTASDRAETVLLNLARGSHRRGLASLRASRGLHDEAPPGHCGGLIQLVRPLLIFCRSDTARFCHERGVPVWVDASNEDPRFRRNRIRAEVMPVLEELHPGASQRISAQAERLAEEEDLAEELADLALEALAALPDPAEAALSAPGRAPELRRRTLMGLSPANRRRLVRRWIARVTGRGLAAAQLDDLLVRLAPQRGSGSGDLAAGWRLHWDRSTVKLVPPGESHG
jgi:tRNA(Ile)-lysidine synthase